MNESWRWENIQNPDWAVHVYKIGRDGASEASAARTGRQAFWVKYVVRDKENKLEHSGERMVHAVDELDLFNRFPAEMQKRWGTNDVRWNIDEVFK